LLTALNLWAVIRNPRIEKRALRSTSEITETSHFSEEAPPKTRRIGE